MINLELLRELKKESSPESRVLLYQSSSRYFRSFQKIPFDSVVLCSNDFSKSEKIGKVYCMKSDNNSLLSTLRDHNISISSAVYIRDGCQEGGNYECTNTASYFGRLLPLLTEQSYILTDHGTDNGFFDVPVTAHNVAIPFFYDFLIRASSPLREPILWKVQKCHSVPHKINLPNISIRIIHDSIFNYLKMFDLIVLFSKNPTGFFNYFGIDVPWAPIFDEYFLYQYADKPRYILFSRTKIANLSKILRFANENGLIKIGFIPFGKGHYEIVFSELTEHRLEYPKEIYLFHLNKADFGFFYHKSMNSEDAN